MFHPDKAQFRPFTLNPESGTVTSVNGPHPMDIESHQYGPELFPLQQHLRNDQPPFLKAGKNNRLHLEMMSQGREQRLIFSVDDPQSQVAGNR